MCQHLSERSYDLSMTSLGLSLLQIWRQKTRLLSAERIHHPAVSSGPIKMLTPFICTTLLLIIQKWALDQKSPCVAAWFITSSCGPHTKFIISWHYPPKSFQGCWKLRILSAIKKRDLHRIWSPNCPASLYNSLFWRG